MTNLITLMYHFLLLYSSAVKWRESRDFCVNIWLPEKKTLVSHVAFLASSIDLIILLKCVFLVINNHF